MPLDSREPLSKFMREKENKDKAGVHFMQNKKAAIAVVGAGSWGTALAIVLADNAHEVRLWSHKEDQVKEINGFHTNKNIYLKLRCRN